MKRKGLCQAIVLVELLLVYCAAQSRQVIQTANCNEDVSLVCPGVDCIDFHSVTWYQLVNGQRFGIIKKRKRDQAPQMYNFARNVSFGENYSLFLPRVKPADSGTYVCGIGANVGGQSQYPTVDLTVNECVTQADPTSQVVVLSPTKAMNTTQSIQVQELPIMWTTAGYVAVALVKIVLSLISIWVLRISFSRKQQRRRCS
ncbi:uncharacterized protein LOC111572136 [Amphiprion ocellaris]|uniref:Ig-like domain-containing protein n=1 Tax=Amphiprion ocellaris TaxID=80972 RepID=A0A3Q1DFB9_AMPOC|nr:uncharacterized protein LOC111572136 [Amphiprion ocellaris]